MPATPTCCATARWSSARCAKVALSAPKHARRATHEHRHRRRRHRIPQPRSYLALPLDGIRLIEASAGTGKTFTLALFTRLVVEQGLRIGQILAVTFTDAATQELRKRIRERLAGRAPGRPGSGRR